MANKGTVTVTYSVKAAGPESDGPNEELIFDCTSDAAGDVDYTLTEADLTDTSLGILGPDGKLNRDVYSAVLKPGTATPTDAWSTYLYDVDEIDYFLGAGAAYGSSTIAKLINAVGGLVSCYNRVLRIVCSGVGNKKQVYVKVLLKK